ncbi:MAG: 4Fe-4S dicluster domain-containing protein [Planctomycetota bacterium]|jgi:Fe-S-cluster-containing dehydrogenase component
MRWGFVLEQESCIGCHACTVGCKAENDVALGSFRTWVKWIETGSFPDTGLHAAVLRCNHCEDAPCVEICPTIALHKREDGIVDLDAERCIGCASCMQACPYDAIHIDPRAGTAAKCHFCAHRLEVGLAPACVSVCPEEAIKVVDLDQPGVREELRDRGATIRKGERGTRPQTFYTGAHPAALDPLAVDGTRTLSHAEVPDPMPAPGTKSARAVYDIPKPRPWGNRIAAYMVTKALASGALIAAAIAPFGTDMNATVLGWLSIAFTAVTVLLLIGDLHQPSRFFFLLTKPNTKSWLVRGGWVLTAHGAVSLVYGLGFAPLFLAALAIPVAVMTSVYTAFLFRQARGRELWCEDAWLPAILGVQAAAAAAVFGWWWGAGGAAFLILYAGFTVASMLTPQKTPGAEQAHHAMVEHPAFRLGLLFAVAAIFFPPLVVAAFALLDWIYVKAGQEVALS